MFDWLKLFKLNKEKIQKPTLRQLNVNISNIIREFSDLTWYLKEYKSQYITEQLAEFAESADFHLTSFKSTLSRQSDVERTDLKKAKVDKLLKGK